MRDCRAADDVQAELRQSLLRRILSAGVDSGSGAGRGKPGRRLWQSLWYGDGADTFADAGEWSEYSRGEQLYHHGVVGRSVAGVYFP